LVEGRGRTHAVCVAGDGLRNYVLDQAGWLGKTEVVFVAGRRHVEVLLSQRTCFLLRADHLPEAARIDAVFTLAHESVHVDGEWSERLADCLGARRFDRVARVAGFKFSKRAVLAFFKGSACYPRR
jgi:hypothetical protein